MDVKSQKQISTQVSGQNNLTRYAFWFAILIVGITIGIFINMKEPVVTSDNIVNPVYSLASIDVARKFVCSCGSCGEEDLDVCTCPTAKSTKRFIEMNLNKGASTADVIELVKAAFGHYKG